MAKKQTVLQKAQNELEEVKANLKDFKLEAEIEIAAAKTRVTNRDFYQGLAWGGAVGAVLALLTRFIF